MRTTAVAESACGPKPSKCLADEWPDKHQKIMRKSDMAAPEFAVYVANAPPAVGLGESTVEGYMCEFNIGVVRIL